MNEEETAYTTYPSKKLHMNEWMIDWIINNTALQTKILIKCVPNKREWPSVTLTSTDELDRLSLQVSYLALGHVQVASHRPGRHVLRGGQLLVLPRLAALLHLVDHNVMYSG